jgi:hypothetical protein
LIAGASCSLNLYVNLAILCVDAINGHYHNPTPVRTLLLRRLWENGENKEDEEDNKGKDEEWAKLNVSFL